MNDAIDTERAGAFAGRVTNILNDGAITVMLCVGHKTGLFDVMAGLPPSSSDAIAEAAGLEERYVRECLAALVTGRIVDYDGARKLYHLPPEHAVSLTRGAGPGNMAGLSQAVVAWASVTEEVVQCFREGGGVPYSSYAHLHEVGDELSGPIHEAGLIGLVVPAMGLTERLDAGVDVLEVGCGAGRVACLLAQAFPKSRIVGIDFEAHAVELARARAAELGLDNVEFRCVDVAKLEDEASFDLVTAFDVVHDLAFPERAVSNIHRALRPDGEFLCVDFASSSNLADDMEHPFGPLLYTGSTMHCMTVSLSQGGAGLGSMWGEQRAVRLLAESGFADVEVRRVDNDPINNYYFARK